MPAEVFAVRRGALKASTTKRVVPHTRPPMTAEKPWATRVTRFSQEPSVHSTSARTQEQGGK